MKTSSFGTVPTELLRSRKLIENLIAKQRVGF
jgi:hypothetical protein